MFYVLPLFFINPVVSYRISLEDKITLMSLVEHLVLNLDRFEAYRLGETALAKVQADIDLGIRLGVDGTPSVFINGRRVYDTRGQALQFLIAHELEHHNHAAGQDSP